MENKNNDIRELHQEKNILGKISEMFINRYRTVYLILMAIFIIGAMSYMQLPRENMPEVESNIVTITTIYSGASPEDVEEMITNPLEDSISGLDDLIKFTSTSASGYSVITLEYEYGIDMEETVEEVKTEVEKVRLPDDVDEPNVMHLKTTEMPILTMSVTGRSDLAAISATADDLKNSFDNALYKTPHFDKAISTVHNSYKSP